MEDSRDFFINEAKRAEHAPEFLQLERRGSARFRTVCRVARVGRANDIGLWRVRNISNEGLMLAADVPAAAGEMLDIALSETVTLRGTIAWTNSGYLGVAFEAPVDAAALLRELAAEQRAEGYRALRLPVEAEAIITLRDGALAIDLIDISRQGAGFRCDYPLDAGTEVDLLLPGSDFQRRALVRWSRDRRGGLWFAQPLDREMLESIVRFRN